MFELNYSSDSETEVERLPVEDEQIINNFLKPELPDYGQKHPDWISHLKGFIAIAIYIYIDTDYIYFIFIY